VHVEKVLDKLGTFIPVVTAIFGKDATDNWQKKFLILASFEITFVVGSMLDLFSAGRFHGCCGVFPRDFPAGLLGIFLAPFIHSDLSVLIVNCIPFFILGAFVLLREDGITTFAFLSGMEILLAGLFIWVLGRRDIDHNGSSGLIFAYFGYLLLYGFFKKEARAALIALLIIIFYGGIIFGTLPTKEKVSWESHLFGFVTGCVVGIWEGEATQHLKDVHSAATDEKKPLTKDHQQHNDDDDLNSDEIDA